MRDERERVFDMLEAIENIERYAGKGREVFERDELIQTWIVHHLEIIRANMIDSSFAHDI